jgi:hypothetical protein
MNADTNPTLDILEAVRSTAMLTDVSLSMWSAERSDPTMLTQIKENAGAVGRIGRATKNLLAGADEPLRATCGAYAAVRTQHYALTLPWVTDPHAERQRGPRLLPNMLFDRYLTAMGLRKREATTALDAFLDVYPSLIERAKLNLAKLFDRGEYPTVEEVRASFRVAFAFEPIPAGASFRGLPPDTAERLTRNLERRQLGQIQAASAAMWTEVKDRVAKTIERVVKLDAPGTVRFHASALENVRELLVLLPGWDVSGSPHVAELVEDIRHMLAGVDADAVRKDTRVRGALLAHATAIEGKLAQWEV